MKTLETVKFMCKDRLNASVTLDDMADFFKPCTAVKIKEWTTHNPYLLGQRNRKTQRPWCYSVLWRYAKTSVEWFDGGDFQESLLQRRSFQWIACGKEWHTMRTEGCHYLLRRSRGHGGPEGPMDHMEGHGGDKEPSHIEDPGVPKGIHLE